MKNISFICVKKIISFIDNDSIALWGFMNLSRRIMDFATYNLDYEWTKKYLKYFNNDTKVIDKRFLFFWTTYLAHITNTGLTSEEEKKLKKIHINKLLVDKIKNSLINDISLDLMIFNNYKNKI